MITSLSTADLTRYVRRQLNGLFPDRKSVTSSSLSVGVPEALERLEYCFKRIAVKVYCVENQAQFNHLYSDQYLMFLWFLSNSLWHRNVDPAIPNKVYLLNKALHGFDCSFSTQLPNIFIVIHGVGTVLGKAAYSNYLTVYHGCTIGQAHGKYPILGHAAGLGAGAAVLGDCHLGNNVSIGAGCTIVSKHVADHSSVYRNEEGKLHIEKTRINSISSEYFNSSLLSHAS